MNSIDLNSDLGEVPGAIADGTQEAMMRHITSANITCGGHAGDDDTIEITILQATRYGLAIGAHPGYPDRENFGRLEMAMPLAAIADTVYEQVAHFAQIAERCGANVTHVKPHGALYNQAVNDAGISRAIAEGVARWRTDIVMIGLAGSRMLDVFHECGFETAAEAFADRRYEPNGTLRARRLQGAMIPDPEQAAAQALLIAEQGTVVASDHKPISLNAQTICIHGDTPGARAIAAAVSAALIGARVQLRGLRTHLSKN
jgi:UPF0271 protein